MNAFIGRFTRQESREQSWRRQRRRLVDRALVLLSSSLTAELIATDAKLLKLAIGSLSLLRAQASAVADKPARRVVLMYTERRTLDMMVK